MQRICRNEGFCFFKDFLVLLLLFTVFVVFLIVVLILFDPRKAVSFFMKLKESSVLCLVAGCSFKFLNVVKI